MGKAAASSSSSSTTKEKEQRHADKDKEKEKGKETNSKAKAKAAEAKEEEPGFLQKLRPKKRAIFFLAFLAGCGAILLLHNGCDIPKNKRQDCGYPDITVTECKWLACFTRGGGSATVKKTVKVSRQEGETLGLQVDPDAVVGWVTVTAIEEGSVMKHNAALAMNSTERILVGDRISKVDSTTASTKKVDAPHKKLVKALAEEGIASKKVSLEIQRPRLPPYLMWLRSTSGKPNTAEKILTAPGTQQFRQTFTSVAGVGFACWLLSGYPLASLPLYYGGASLAVAFYTVRCCHDDDVQGGVAHCYKPATNELNVVLDGIKTSVTAAFQKFYKDPVKVLKRWFVFW